MGIDVCYEALQKGGWGQIVRYVIIGWTLMVVFDKSINTGTKKYFKNIEIFQFVKKWQK